MKILIDVPDKYVEGCKSLLTFLCDENDDLDDEVEIYKALDQMKESTVELDMSSLEDGKGKQLGVGLLMIALSQKIRESKG